MYVFQSWGIVIHFTTPTLTFNKSHSNGTRVRNIFSCHLCFYFNLISCVYAWKSKSQEVLKLLSKYFYSIPLQPTGIETNISSSGQKQKSTSAFQHLLSCVFLIYMWNCMFITSKSQAFFPFKTVCFIMKTSNVYYQRDPV